MNLEERKKLEEKAPAEKLFSEFALFCNQFGLKMINEKPEYKEENFINSEIVITEDSLSEYMENVGITTKPPVKISISKGTTLFFSAAVQHLDSIIQDEEPLIKDTIFVSQPVMRTQYIGSNQPCSFSSFCNVATLACGADFTHHLALLKHWLDLLIDSGFKKELMELMMISTEPKIGKRKYINYPMKIFYSGLEIGDAVFIPFYASRYEREFFSERYWFWVRAVKL